MRLMMLCMVIRRVRPLVCRRGFHGRSLATLRSAAAAVDASRAISEYVALPPEAADGLRSLGLEAAAPVQAAVWAEAMGGKSACVHAPTGSGKTLAMVLPVVASTLWAGRGNPGRVVVLVPTRELVAQHETLLSALGAATAVVTSATLGAPGGAEALADAIDKGDLPSLRSLSVNDEHKENPQLRAAIHKHLQAKPFYRFRLNGIEL